jgi:SAM-dependent methyltransferase
MSNNLTTRQFWVDYWNSKNNLIFEVPDKYPFVEHLGSIINKNKSQSLLELGGFPGYFSVWACKNFKIKATLFDYVVLPEMINQLEVANQLKPNSIEIIEGDLFNYSFVDKYDIVISNGLIEHFEDTKNIIEKHTNQLNVNGILLITLPNFKSLNGWFQKTFDLENYNKHNIKCMDLALLRDICQDLGLKNIKVKYEGKFMIWLENESEKSFLTRLLKKMIWLPLKIFFKIVPIETRFFSPYIKLTAQKP